MAQRPVTRARVSAQRARARSQRARPLRSAEAAVASDWQTIREVPASPQPARLAGLDALRGLALVAMIVYHFCFDLRYFGITHSDFEHDLRWLTARTLILASFLAIAGMSTALGHRRALPVGHALRHIAIIAGTALLVSAASYAVFPQSFIWFGVLHAIAVSLLLAQPLAGRPIVAAIVGIAAIAAGIALAHPAFDNRALGWIGFMTQKPVTEDYVPLFPWTGVLLLGITVGHALARSGFAALAPFARVPAAIRWLGRHSLAVYLVHQPLMIGVLWLATRYPV